jgi:hypothetical protein
MPIKRPRSPGNKVGNAGNYFASDVAYPNDSHDRCGFQKKAAISAFVPKPLHPRPILPTPNQIKYQIWDRQVHPNNVVSGASSDDTSTQTSINTPTSAGETYSPMCVIPPMTHFDHDPNKKEAGGEQKKEKEGMNKSGRKRGISDDEICAAMTLSTCFQNNK